MPKRLRVIDGADQGQSFWLPASGTVLLGNSRKHCDICLHDLYVGRVHCHLEIAVDRILVRAMDTPAGTLVNGVKTQERELQLGDVLRAGNSQLRLEEAEQAAPAPAPRATEHPGKLAPLPAERLGELRGLMLGHFKIGHVLGRGHGSVVFRAQDVKKNEEVALKILAPSFPANDAEMQQFVRVVKPLLSLRHPNLVAWLGAGKTGPYVWIAQELVEGESLTSVLGQLRTARKIKWRRACRLAVGLAQALEFLHEHRLVHSNITPANLVVRASDGLVKLNDLGLQKALEGSQLQQATLEYKLLSEMSYLSPEHIDPNVAADDLSDLYSLGVVFYALLTGQLPSEGTSPEDTLMRIREVLPEKPKNLQRGIPDEVQAIVLRLLAKRPEERYPSPGALLADLQRLAAGPDDNNNN